MMAIRIRDRRAYMRVDVTEHRSVSENGKTIYEIVCRDGGGDSDQIVIRSGWPKLHVEFPVGTDIALEMTRERPQGVQGPRV